MRSLSMLLALFIFSSHLYAQTADNHGPSQDIYPEYPDAFFNQTRPDPSHTEEPSYLKLILPAEDKDKTRTYKANFTAHDHMKS